MLFFNSVFFLYVRFFVFLLLISVAVIAVRSRAWKKEITYLFCRLPTFATLRDVINGFDEERENENHGSLVKIVLWNSGTTPIRREADGPVPSIMFQFARETMPINIMQCRGGEASVDISSN